MSRTLSILSALAALTIGAGTRAQVPATSVQLTGKVNRITLAPSGLPDGFFLDIGVDVEVHFPRYLGSRLATSVRRGELVRVQGAFVSDQHLIVGTSVTDVATNAAVIDEGETGLPQQTLSTGTPSSAEGQIRALLHDSHGRVDGALLDNDVMVRLPEGVPDVQPQLLVTGGYMAVTGQEIDTENGRVIRIDSMGASASELTPVQQPTNVGEQ